MRLLRGTIVTASLVLVHGALAERSCAAADPTLPPAANRTVDFKTDIQPILRDTCWSCHGPQRKESGYRLDVKSIALSGGDSYAPNIIPSNSAESPLIQFVAGAVDGMQMPAKGPPLTAEQIGLLRAWIDQGAPWPESESAAVDERDWWSLRPLARPPLPPLQPGSRNAIDAFIREKLGKNGLAPAPEADRRTLIRRLYFDLIGLPPTPQEIAAFQSSTAPDAYERLVDSLFQSPRYGERWARHWLDTVHFAETHGHDQDRIREHAWPYRDYLIHSLNDDKPYGRLIEEQVAGDALFPGDPQATVALGFVAAGPWDESSLRDIREDTLDRQIGRYLDRDDMLSNVLNNVISMSVQCARCHDHKFDPISQADYYALQAVFSGVERANRIFDLDPQVHQRRQSLLQRKKILMRADAAVAAELLSPAIQEEIAAWERSLDESPVRWSVATPERWESEHSTQFSLLPDGSLLSTGTPPDLDTYTITIPLPPQPITALRLEVLTDDSLPKRGPGRQDNGNLHLSEIEVYVGGREGQRVALAKATADFNQDGWTVSMAHDGNPQTAWGIFPQVGQSHQAVFEFQQPVAVQESGRLTVVLKQLHGAKHLIGRARLSITGAPPEQRLEPLPIEILALLRVPAAKRTEAQRVTLALFQQQEKTARELAALPKPSYVYAAASDFEPDGALKPPPGPRPIHVLRRGDIRQPLAEALPGALSCLTPLPARFELTDPGSESGRRVALARWLTDPRNPLTWRSIVNRVWHHHFGRGLVTTPNDFGRMGAEPSHPELLDWLAVEFRDGRQSLKELHRLIVCSATYRQASAAREHLGSAGVTGTQRSSLEQPGADAENKLLARMNRTRLDAECVRDAILAISDRLDLRMGGPSDRQFGLQPGRHVTPIVDYQKFNWDDPAGRRRSVYRFLFRTLPDPFMESLDCPAGDQITPVRTNTVTVQQALAMWNDAFVVRNCEYLVARLETLAHSAHDRVRLAFQWTLCREPTPEEAVRFTAYSEKHGLANLCRLLFNSNEFVFVN